MLLWCDLVPNRIIWAAEWITQASILFLKSWRRASKLRTSATFELQVPRLSSWSLLSQLDSRMAISKFPLPWLYALEVWEFSTGSLRQLCTPCTDYLGVSESTTGAGNKPLLNFYILHNIFHIPAKNCLPWHTGMCACTIASALREFQLAERSPIFPHLQIKEMCNSFLTYIELTVVVRHSKTQHH